MGELKQIKILSLKSLIVNSFTSNTKKFCKALIDAPIGFLITPKGLKMRKIQG
jgi:hypothetical protein